MFFTFIFKVKHLEFHYNLKTVILRIGHLCVDVRIGNGTYLVKILYRLIMSFRNWIGFAVDDAAVGTVYQ